MEALKRRKEFIEKGILRTIAARKSLDCETGLGKLTLMRPTSSIAISGVDCEMRFDNLTRQLYATDASHYQIEPKAVAFPKTAQQAGNAIKFALENSFSVTPRGAGTGLVGGALGDGLVIDFSRRNRRITDLNLEKRTVRVAAGVVLDQLNTFLQPHGFCFGPDVATSSRATLGGMIANNSSGSHTPVYGTTADHVRSLEIVLADGTIKTIGQNQNSLSTQRAEIQKLAGQFAQEIEARFPAGLLKRWPGYGIDRWLRSPGNLSDILAGSEGTLAAIFSAELKIVPLPKKKEVGLIFFASVAEAMQATVELLDLKPAAIEHIDRVLFDQTKNQIAFKAARDLLQLDDKPCESILVVEFYDDDSGKLAALEQKHLGLRKLILKTPAEANLVWSLRKAGLSLLTGRKGPAKPVTCVEDTVIRPEHLPEYVTGLESIFKRLNLEASFYGHAASGLLHVRPVLDLHSATDLKKFRQLSNEVSALVLQFKGSLAGEHGVGIARTEFLAEHLGPNLLKVFQGIKDSFDPKNIFNPGKVIDDGRFKIDQHLRYASQARARHAEIVSERGSSSSPHEERMGRGPRRGEFLEQNVPPLPGPLLHPMEEREKIITTHGVLRQSHSVRAEELSGDGAQGTDAPYQLPFTPVLAFAAKDESFIGNLEQCNGCGGCRKDAPTMCPTFVATGEEIMSTRGRANTIRAALEHRLSGNDALVSEELDAALENCLSCKACTTECPSNVNMALLKAELLHARWQRDGLPLNVRLFSNVDLLGKLGSLFSSVANASLKSSFVRGAMEKFLGIAVKRPLPSYTANRFDRWFAKHQREPKANSRGNIILWDDTFVRYHEPEIGIAAVKVLETAGFEVVLAQKRKCCGRPAFSQGNLREAARLGKHNLDLLGSEDSTPILFLEPSCYSMFVEDYRELKLSNAEQIAKRCFLFEEFVENFLSKNPDAIRFAEKREPIAIHVHCHAKSLLNPAFMSRLAQRLPSRKVTLLETGCCGMAGAFGALKSKYELSLQVAEPLVEKIQSQPAGTIVVASGTSCRHQIEHLTTAQPKHMAELLADALVQGGGSANPPRGVFL